MSLAEDEKRTRASLDALRASWSEAPPVVEFRFEIGEDSTGDPAVFVIAVLPEETRDEDWTSAYLLPLAHAVKNAIRNARVDRIVYTRFARPSDLTQPVEGEEE